MLVRPPPVAIVRPPKSAAAPSAPVAPRHPDAPQSLTGDEASSILDLDGGPFGAPSEWILRRSFYLASAASGAPPAFFAQATSDYAAFIRCRPVSWCHGENRLDPSPRVYQALQGDPMGWWDLQDKLPFEPVATAAGRLLSLRGFEDGDAGLPAAIDETLARMTPWQTFAADRAIDIHERRIDPYRELGITPPQVRSKEREILDDFFVEVVRAVAKPVKAVQTERTYDISDVRHMASGGVARVLAWAARPVIDDRTNADADLEGPATDAVDETGEEPIEGWGAPAA